MNKQSEALRLADELDMQSRGGIWYSSSEAAEELRRLAAVEAERDAQRAELERIRAEQPAKQESEAVKAAWLAGYTEGEKAAWAESDALLRQALEALVWEAGSEPALYAAQTYAAITALRERLKHMEGS